MKVLLVNGSPHKDGTMHRALREVADTLEKRRTGSKPRFSGSGTARSRAVSPAKSARNSESASFTTR